MGSRGIKMIYSLVFLSLQLAPSSGARLLKRFGAHLAATGQGLLGGGNGYSRRRRLGEDGDVWKKVEDADTGDEFSDVIVYYAVEGNDDGDQPYGRRCVPWKEDYRTTDSGWKCFKIGEKARAWRDKAYAEEEAKRRAWREEQVRSAEEDEIINKNHVYKKNDSYVIEGFNSHWKDAAQRKREGWDRVEDVEDDDEEEANARNEAREEAGMSRGNVYKTEDDVGNVDYVIEGYNTDWSDARDASGWERVTDDDEIREARADARRKAARKRRGEREPEDEKKPEKEPTDSVFKHSDEGYKYPSTLWDDKENLKDWTRENSKFENVYGKRVSIYGANANECEEKRNLDLTELGNEGVRELSQLMEKDKQDIKNACTKGATGTWGDLKAEIHKYFPKKVRSKRRRMVTTDGMVAWSGRYKATVDRVLTHAGLSREELTAMIAAYEPALREAEFYEDVALKEAWCFHFIMEQEAIWNSIKKANNLKAATCETDGRLKLFNTFHGAYDKEIKTFQERKVGKTQDKTRMMEVIELVEGRALQAGVQAVGALLGENANGIPEQIRVGCAAAGRRR